MKLIIFDLAGVCFYNEEPPFLKEFAEKHSLDFQEFEKYYDSLLYPSEEGKTSGRSVWENVLNHYKINSSPDKIIKDMMERRYPFEKVLDIVQKLRKKFKVAYLTNLNEDYYNAVKDKFPLKKLFDFGYVSYELGVRKPNAKGFKLILEHFKVKPHDAIFIDDSKKNLADPAKLGIKTIHYINPYQLASDLEELGIPSDKELLDEMKRHELYPQGGEVKIAYILAPFKSIVEIKKDFGISFEFAVGYIKDNYIDVSWAKEKMVENAQQLLDRQLENPHFLDEIEAKWQAEEKEFHKLYDIKPSGLQEAADLFYRLGDMKQWRYLIFLDAFDVDGHNILRQAVERYDKKLLGKIDSLTVPDELTYVQQEKHSRLKIALQFNREFLKANKPDDLPAPALSALKQHRDNFYWYKNNYAVALDLDEKYFFDEIKKAVSFSKIEHHQKKQPQLSGELKVITDFFRKMAILRDKRKAAQNRAITHMHKVLEFLSSETNIPLELLENMGFFEAPLLVHDKERLVAKLKQRRNGMCIYCSESGFYLLTGKVAEDIKLLLEKKLMAENELVGICASKGKVKGSVKVINKVSEFSKFLKGDILVSANTRPEFVPIMEKAAAIITDEGGITCHAAIVSRELGIPCIVGTTFATKFFKDGDVVEVNADKGIVKKRNL